MNYRCMILVGVVWASVLHGMEGMQDQNIPPMVEYMYVGKTSYHHTLLPVVQVWAMRGTQLERTVSGNLGKELFISQKSLARATKRACLPEDDPGFRRRQVLLMKKYRGCLYVFAR